ncbi:MAG: 5-oxoprolinase subunit PxpB [Sediminibacterium magnilacihabitans]|jgi:inhibitor of KinA|nr:5-oxoprolinase subunit PxpB [Sediminibacterium magnilacihabitans]PQV60191.1 inhibitor of KinA [Sediminibacterium magnilacihabitans]
MLSIPPYQLRSIGDHALLIDFGQCIDEHIHQWVMAIYDYFQQEPLAGLLDCIPAYSSIAFVYDLVFWRNKTGNSTVVDYLGRIILERLSHVQLSARRKINRVDVPVCYDPALGIDIINLAAAHGLTVEQVINMHASKSYHVYMLGFLPGFAYMGKVDPRIATERLQQPRTLVKAGSVGIAGEQTGIYPVDSPGGWQLIGQTPLRVFDPRKKNPCFFAPGDEVLFYPITLSEFQKIKEHESAHR